MPERNPGRQPKRPRVPKRLHPEELLGPKALQVLTKCGAPAHWGVEEALVLRDYAAHPSDVLRYCERLRSEDLEKLPPHIKESRERMRRRFPVKEVRDGKLKMLLKFDQLFAEAPDAVSRALPLLRALWDKCFRSPELSAVAEIAMRADCAQMWESSAQELADWLHSDETPMTAKVVEHARRRVRELLEE